ncbi:uncharacterized protein LOC131490944 [Neofelis nebulosa]|uniref:uncharacterized protein LOC131490944 n=1 Tax=Neofelis nebulosa TaxID=61452 RepID=UPI00272D4061|nr:uncharacterized protein LOC131490944 [Neofelis nebulosa]
MAFILQMRKCKLKSARANPNPGAESGRGGGATLRLGDGLQDRAAGAGGREAAAVRTIGGATRLQLGLPGGSRGRASRPFSVPRGRPRRHRPVGPRRPPYVFGALGVAPPPAEAKAKAQTDAQAGDRRTFERPDPPPHTLSPQLPPRPGRRRFRRRGPYTLGLSWACGVDGRALCSGCALVGGRGEGPGGCATASGVHPCGHPLEYTLGPKKTFDLPEKAWRRSPEGSKPCAHY